MPELLVDFITSLDGYGAAEGWPGLWGLEGPEYLAWLDDEAGREHTLLMGANTYRLMSGMAAANADDPVDVGQHATRRLRHGRGRAGDEGERLQPPAHHGQPRSVPVPADGRP